MERTRIYQAATDISACSLHPFAVGSRAICRHHIEGVPAAVIHCIRLDLVQARVWVSLYAGHLFRIYGIPASCSKLLEVCTEPQ